MHDSVRIHRHWRVIELCRGLHRHIVNVAYSPAAFDGPFNSHGIVVSDEGMVESKMRTDFVTSPTNGWIPTAEGSCVGTPFNSRKGLGWVLRRRYNFRVCSSRVYKGMVAVGRSSG